MRYIKEPIVIAGTSAGAMAFSTSMIISGNKDNQQLVRAVRIATGFSLLKNICVDTHFVDQSRFVRMSQVIATNPGCIGIGIEEETALVVEHGNHTNNRNWCGHHHRWFSYKIFKRDGI